MKRRVGKITLENVERFLIAKWEIGNITDTANKWNVIIDDIYGAQSLSMICRVDCEIYDLFGSAIGQAWARVFKCRLEGRL